MIQRLPSARILLAVRLGDDSAANAVICGKLAEVFRRTFSEQLSVEPGNGTLAVSYNDDRLSLSDLMRVAAQARLRLAII